LSTARYRNSSADNAWLWVEAATRRSAASVESRLVPHGGALERQHDAELRAQSAQPVDGGGALLEEALAHAVHAEQGLLLGGLDWHEAHGGRPHRRRRFCLAGRSSGTG
jgi:hypothetical protein